MKDLIPDWKARLIGAKQQLKDQGIIDGDADIAVRITELLQTIEQPEIERGAVNHWLKGKRQPNISQFVALCAALKQRPSDVLNTDYPVRTTRKLSVKEKASIYALPDADIAELLTLLDQATPENRRIAIGAARGALLSASEATRGKETA